MCLPKNGHLECLKYAHENGCPWDEYTCTAAADYGHLEILQYAHDNGCAGSAKYAHLLPRAQTHEPLVRHLIFCLTTGTSRQWYRYHTYLVFCILKEFEKRNIEKISHNFETCNYL